MKKVIFGITSLQIGGAERVLVDLCNKLKDEYAITIFTIYDNGELKKQLSNRISVKSVYKKRYEDYDKIQKIAISIKLLFTKIPEGYDDYVAFLEGPITRLFAKNIKNKRKNIKKIAWIHNDISKVFGKGIKSKIKEKVDKHLYKKYDKLIFVSEENKDDFNKLYGSEKYNEEVIRNYLDYKNVIEKSNQDVYVDFDEKDINLVSVCRLVDQKAIDRFIKIHSKLENDGIHSKVYIIGEGNLHYALQKQIDSLGETENFYLLGAKQNPYVYMKKADYFCLLSYYEGYGMVLDEAKILNKEIIITKTAAVEGIKDYKKKTILENTDKGIYEGLKAILTGNNVQNANKEEVNDEYIAKLDEYYNGIIKKVEKILR